MCTRVRGHLCSFSLVPHGGPAQRPSPPVLRTWELSFLSQRCCGNTPNPGWVWRRESLAWPPEVLGRQPLAGQGAEQRVCLHGTPPRPRHMPRCSWEQHTHIPACGASATHACCTHVWHTLPGTRHPQGTGQGLPSSTCSVCSGGLQHRRLPSASPGGWTSRDPGVGRVGVS